MSQRNLSLAVCLFLAALAASGQTSYVFQVPGPNGTTTQLVGLGDSDFSRTLSGVGLAGTYQVLATPDGSRFYFVAATGIQSAPAPTPPSTTLSPTTIGGISGTVTSAGMTPDGKYLLAIASIDAT